MTFLRRIVLFFSTYRFLLSRLRDTRCATKVTRETRLPGPRADGFYSDPSDQDANRGLIPPQPIHWFQGASFSPYVHTLEATRDPVTFKRVVIEDETIKIPVRLFAHGYEYKLLGLFTTDFLTSFVAYVRDENLYVHFSKVDWPIPKSPDEKVPEPWEKSTSTSFRVVPGAPPRCVPGATWRRWAGGLIRE